MMTYDDHRICTWFQGGLWVFGMDLRLGEDAVGLLPGGRPRSDTTKKRRENGVIPRGWDEAFRVLMGSNMLKWDMLQCTLLRF